MKRSFSRLVGNDIVDLGAAGKESNWRRSGYLEKVFTESEQASIAVATDQGRMVWLLWSMKEAAYKIDSRRSGIRAYAPIQLQCYLHKCDGDDAEGWVDQGGHRYFTQSLLTRDYIHTIAAQDVQQLAQVEVSLHPFTGRADFDYHATRPQCVSHHGAYLALVYLNLSSPQSAG